MKDIPAVEISDLTFSWQNGVKTLEDISLSVNHGEKIAIIGANGAGKSTLLLHLNGILVTTDKIKICGLPVIPKNLKLIRQKIGLVFQNPDDQLFSLTLFDDLAFGPRNMGIEESKIPELVETSLNSVGLSGFANRTPFHLSLGEKKRAAMGTVLSMNPDILALDEPTSNLDPRGCREIIELLKSIDKTLIIVTHNLKLVEDLCERTIVLDHGKIVADRETTDVLNDRELLLSCGLV